MNELGRCVRKKVLSCLKKIPNGFKLLATVVFKFGKGRFAFLVGIAGHLGVGSDAGGIMHPAIEEAFSQTVFGEVEIDSDDFEGCGGGLSSQAVTGGATESGLGADELFAESDGLGVGLSFEWKGGWQTVLGGHSGGEGFGCVVAESRHAGVEPRTWSRFAFSLESRREGVGEQHFAGVGKGREALVHLVGDREMGSEEGGLGMEGAEEGGEVVAGVAGGATERAQLAFGEGSGGVSLEGSEMSAAETLEGLAGILGEIEMTGLRLIAGGVKPGLFDDGLEGREGGRVIGEARVAGTAVHFFGKSGSVAGVSGGKGGRLGGDLGGCLQKIAGEVGRFFLVETKIGHAGVRGKFGRVAEKVLQSAGLKFCGEMIEGNTVVRWGRFIG